MEAERLAIVVATHLRPALLPTVVQAWANTAPGYRALHVLVNHPDGAATLDALPERCRVTHTGRTPEHAGCMARTWNLALQWAFRDPEVAWCLCAMDDTQPLPGWPAVVASRDADLYLAPAGDAAFLLNRRALREVGWFDERFAVIGFQEWDWEALRALGADRVVLEDAHGWTVNGIGLTGFWQANVDASRRSMDHQERNRAWLAEKWGAAADSGGGFWGAATTGPGPRVPELEPYPWFDRG